MEKIIRRKFSLFLAGTAQFIMTERKIPRFLLFLARKINPDPASVPDFIDNPPRVVRDRYSRR